MIFSRACPRSRAAHVDQARARKRIRDAFTEAPTSTPLERRRAA